MKSKKEVRTLRKGVKFLGGLRLSPKLDSWRVVAAELSFHSLKPFHLTKIDEEEQRVEMIWMSLICVRTAAASFTCVESAIEMPGFLLALLCYTRYASETR